MQASLSRDVLFVVVPIGMLAIIGVVLWAVPRLWLITVGAEDPRRNNTLDGVRGLLSMWVLTHHLNTIPPLLTQASGPPVPPPGAVTLLMMSSFFTAPFFALTGMLFGGALLASRGKLDGWQFLRNRVYRIVPVYALSVILVVTIAFFMTGFRLRVPMWELAKDLVRWSSFGFLPMYDINGAPVWRWHGMLWTLPYEIMFYVLLPLLAWGQRRLRSPVVLIGGLGLVALVEWQFTFFTAGVVAAAAVGWKHRFATYVWSVLAICAVILLGVTAAYTGPLAQAVLLIPLLVAAALQAPMLWPLKVKPIRFVGEMSYSIYILHFPLICILITLMIDPGSLNAPGGLAGAALLAVAGATIIGISAVSYVFVERPVIAWGKRSGFRDLARPSRLFGRGVTVPGDRRSVSGNLR